MERREQTQGEPRPLLHKEPLQMEPLQMEPLQMEPLQAAEPRRGCDGGASGRMAPDKDSKNNGLSHEIVRYTGDQTLIFGQTIRQGEGNVVQQAGGRSQEISLIGKTLDENT